MTHGWDAGELAMALRPYVYGGQLHLEEAGHALGTERLRPNTSTIFEALGKLNEQVCKLLYKEGDKQRVSDTEKLRTSWSRLRSADAAGDAHEPGTATTADPGADNASVCGTEDAEHDEPCTAAAADSQRRAEGTGAAAAADAEIADSSDEESVSSELTASSTPEGVKAATDLVVGHMQEQAHASRLRTRFIKGRPVPKAKCTAAGPQRPKAKGKGTVRAARSAGSARKGRPAAMNQYWEFVREHGDALKRAGVAWQDAMKQVTRMWREQQALETGNPYGCPKCKWKGCNTCQRYPPQHPKYNK